MSASASIPLVYDYRQRLAGGATLVMIQGLGMHMRNWPPAFLEVCAANFNLLLFDNRDSGRSPQCGPVFEMNAEIRADRLFGTAPTTAPYDLFDMAADVVALMDRLKLEQAHIAGFSMGGMIAQIIAALYPDRVLSLTSLMSSGGQAWITCSDQARRALIRSMAGFKTRPSAIADAVEGMRIFGVKARALSDTQLAASAAASFDYAYSPGGTLRQALAIRLSGDRSDLLRAIRAPTFVVSGGQDPCIHPDQARALARLVRSARFHLFDSIGHDLADLDTSDLESLMRELRQL